jgi:ribosomal protein L6P/L9E
MAEFNIENSKVEQVNDNGDNIKITGNSGQLVVSHDGNAVQTAGTENKVKVEQGKKETFWSELWGKIKGCWKWLSGGA